VVELRAHAVSRRGQRRRVDSGVIRTAFRMAVQRGGVGAGTERPAGAGDDDDPYAVIVFRFGEDPAVLDVHASGPRVEPVGTIQRDARDATADLVLDDLEVH